jgi:hypothetical protein
MPEPMDTPAILHHYTSVDSFKRILESRKMRATRFDQMNDESEVQLGVQRLLESVRKHEAHDSHRQYKEFLISGIEGFKGDLQVYVLSFSATADDLDQWRAYAPDGGVAIGFDLKKVAKGFLSDITPHVGGLHVENPIRPNPANQLLRCLYTDKNGNIDLQSLVAERFFQDNSYPVGFRSLERSDQILLASLSVSIYQTICCIKHGAYSTEREWRCLNYRPDPTDYPIRLSDRNRFCIELDFDPKEFIKEVWVSPHGDRQGIESAVTYFKERDQLPFVIHKSRIPFRR